MKLLVVLALLSLAASAAAQSAPAPAPSKDSFVDKLKNVTVYDAWRDTVLNSTAIYLDVRTDEEWAAGHVPGAVHVPTLTRGVDGKVNVANANFVKQVKELIPDKNAKIYVGCRSAVRSKDGGLFLLLEGYTDVSNVLGSHLDWQTQNLPLEFPATGLLPYNYSGIAELALRTIYPNGFPRGATYFLPSDLDLVTYATQFGVNATNVRTAVDGFVANETALAQLRTVLLYSTSPGGEWTQSDLAEYNPLSTASLPTALGDPSKTLRFNATGTRVLTGAKSQTTWGNIVGKGDTPNIYVVDYPLSPWGTITNIPGTTAEEASALVKSWTSAYGTGVAAPSPAPKAGSVAGRRLLREA